MKLVAAGAALILVASVSGTHGDDYDEQDHELARKALLEGRIQSLQAITKVVTDEVPGEILAVKIEISDRGRFVYEFDILMPGGKLKEVDVDATTAEILEIEEDD